MDERQVLVLERIKGGATVWGYGEAMVLRTMQREGSDLVEIIDLGDLEEILGEKFDGAGRLPYFGAILTKKGHMELNEWKKEKDRTAMRSVKENAD